LHPLPAPHAGELHSRHFLQGLDASRALQLGAPML
jgi:hypothetical protein